MKTNPRPKYRMICAVCSRPLMRAAALLKGQPVGRVCAVSAGLLAPAKPRSLFGSDPVTRDTKTIDLFAP